MNARTPRYLLYFPACASFYWTDCLAVAETIIAAHWGIMGEVSDGGRVVLRASQHDTDKVNAARRALDSIGGYSRDGSTFLCV